MVEALLELVVMAMSISLKSKGLFGVITLMAKVGVVIIIMSGCATSPLGRSQISLVPDAQMNSMGSAAYSEMKTKVHTEVDTPMAKYIQCIARPIAAASNSGIPGDQWEIRLFQDDTANAFALPGGKIGVHTGLLKVAKTDSQLAAVLGHEVGHVIAKHGKERVSQGMLTQGGLVVASAALGEQGGAKNNALMAALGLGAQYGILLPFGRTQESEADLIGLDLMARVGFDPRESVQLWKNMIGDHGGKAPPEWMSTHPASENRIANLQAHFREAMPKYEAAKAAGTSPVCQRP